MLTGEDLQQLQPHLSAAEIEHNLRELLAKGMLIAICGDEGPTRFEITHNGRRELEDAR